MGADSALLFRFHMLSVGQHSFEVDPKVFSFLSNSALSNVTAGIGFLAVLLSGVHHNVCALFALMSHHHMLR